MPVTRKKIFQAAATIFNGCVCEQLSETDINELSYKLLAASGVLQGATIRAIRQECIFKLVLGFATYFRQDNPNFDPYRFAIACGYDEAHAKSIAWAVAHE
jgi:hypothetical protein